MISFRDLQNVLFGADHAEAVDLTSVDYAPAHLVRTIWVGGTGDVKIDTAGGETGVTFKNAPVGFLDVHPVKIYKTGTTATLLVACW